MLLAIYQMMARFQDSPDSFMIDYHPYRGGQNRYHQGDSKTLVFMKGGSLYDKNREAAFLRRIIDWLKREVEPSIDQNKRVVIAIAPGHKSDSNPTGFMHDIVKKLAQEYPVIDGGQQLIRVMDVAKSATTAGLRSMERHSGTIGINGNDPDNKGKVVVILDDVWTSGSTLNACREVMLTTKPEEIRLFAIGKTASYNIDGIIF